MNLQTVSPASLKGEIAELKELLAPLAREAYLFGSFPGGSAVKGESDADLLVVPQRPLSLKELYTRLDVPIESFLSAGLTLHIVIFDSARHPKELLESARSGIKLV